MSRAPQSESKYSDRPWRYSLCSWLRSTREAKVPVVISNAPTDCGCDFTDGWVAATIDADATSVTSAWNAKFKITSR
jgi:hypothetical protein